MAAGMSGLMAMAGCEHGQPASDGSSHTAALPSCQALMGRIPASALRNPTERFAQPTEADTPTDVAPSSTLLCPILGVAVDGKTPLQVQIWLHRVAAGADHGDQARTLGDLAVDQTSQYCASVRPATTGDPVTSSRCSAPTVDGQVAGLAIVRRSAVVGIRIDAKQAAGTDAQLAQMLQTEAQRIADAVVGAL
jgi:hypothetical protein